MSQAEFQTIDKLREKTCLLRLPAESRIRPRVTLLAAEDVAGGVRLTWGVTIEVEGGEKPACIAETLSRLYFQ